MIISLHQRTEAHVRTYFERTLDEDIRKTLPASAETLEQALALYQQARLPGSTSFGRTIYADGVYMGDVWCYGIQQEEPNAMLSYCIFAKNCWGKGIATEAVRLFLFEVKQRFRLESMGAFTFADHIASNRVLEKNGFTCAEEFEENGRACIYWQC